MNGSFKRIIMKIYCLLFVLVLLCSCAEEPFVVRNYWEGTKTLKDIKYYNSKKDSFPSKEIVYYSDGTVKDTLRYNLAGQLHGNIYMYLKDPDVSVFGYFVDGQKDGIASIVEKERRIIQYFNRKQNQYISCYHDTTGILRRRVLFFDRNPLVEEERFFVSEGDSLKNFLFFKDGHDISVQRAQSSFVLYNYWFYGEGQEIVKMGSLSKELDGTVIESLTNSYHELNFNDSIKNGEMLCGRITGYFGNYREGVTLKVSFGDLDSELNLKDVYFSAFGEKGQSHINFCTDHYLTGYNILTGKLELFRDNKKLFETIIFDKFYVE